MTALLQMRLARAWLFAAVAFALFLPACGGAEGPSTASFSASPSPSGAATSSSPARASVTASATVSARLAHQFPRPTGPLALEITGAGRWDGAPVRHITYRSEGAVVTATLSVPDGRGPFPAALYAPGVSCSRDMFAADVAALRRDGVAALAVDPPDGRDPFVHPVLGDPATVAEAHVRYVADLRRGLDVLLSLPEIDGGRIAYIGYSWGGFVGGYLAGLGEPIRAFVLTYAGADWIGVDPTEAEGFAADPAAALGAASPGSYLFIAGADDPLFSRSSVTRYYRAAEGDARLVWLPGGHGDHWASPAGSVAVDHRAWLERRL